MAKSIREPTPAYVRRRLDELDGDDQFYGAESAVQAVFQQWPTNTALHEVLVKTVVLNRLYSTNIYDVWSVATHITDLAIDDRLRAGDHSLVHDIASVRLGGKLRYQLSFASKYCAWHEQDKFQIFDSRVEQMLWSYKHHFQFATFFRWHLREYFRFLDIVEKFKRHFGLAEFSRKELDKFLWIEGSLDSY